jgi:hypothetical protein
MSDNVHPSGLVAAEPAPASRTFNINWKKCGEVTLVACAVAGTVIAGASFWWGIRQWYLEKDDRAEERAARHAAIIQDAFDIVGEVPTGGTLQLTPSLATAIRTLLANGERVDLRAKRIDLEGLDVACGDITLSAEEVRLDQALFSRARVFIEADIVSASMSAANSLVQISGPDDNKVYVNANAANSLLDVAGRPYLDLAATYLQLKTDWTTFMLNGQPGPLVLETRDVDYWRERESTVQIVHMTVVPLSDQVRDEIGLTKVQDYTNFAPGLTIAVPTFRDYLRNPQTGLSPDQLDAGMHRERRVPVLPPDLRKLETATPIFNHHSVGYEDVERTEAFGRLCPDWTCKGVSISPPDRGNCSAPNLEVDWYPPIRSWHQERVPDSP